MDVCFIGVGQCSTSDGSGWVNHPLSPHSSETHDAGHRASVPERFYFLVAKRGIYLLHTLSLKEVKM